MSAEVIPFDQRRADETLPANIETEACLLGSMMIENSLVDRVAEIVGPEHFFESLHSRIFSAILREHSAGKPANVVTLNHYFVSDPGMKEVPGYLAQLTGNFGAAGVVGAVGFAHQILELAKRRAMIAALRDALTDVADVQQDLPDITDRIDTALSGALETKANTTSRTIAQAFDETLSAIEEEAAGRGVRGIHVRGLDDFNDLTGNLRPGELMYIGGRPSMGKTALAIRLALGAALGGHGTLFVSLEMRVPELTTRAMADLIFDYGHSPGYEAIRRGRLDMAARERMVQARQVINSCPLTLTDPHSLNIARLAMMIRRYKRQMEARGQSLELVIIDYLGLIKGPDKRAKRYEEVGDISRTLKMVAKECNVAMIVLAQLNRECERRDDKRPMLSDLRDAGDIEQDADQVLFVYRDEYYLERSEPEPGDKKRAEWEISMGHARDRVEIIAAKVRNGRVGKRTCYFFAHHQAVRDHTYMRSLP